MKHLEKYRGKHILITGCNGYIGSLLTDSFRRIECRLTLIDLSSCRLASKNQTGQAEIVFQQADISKKETWEHTLQGVDIIFHLAALEYDRIHFDIEKDYETNTLAVRYLLDACRRYSCAARIVFSSSANLFGEIRRLPVDESVRDIPNSLWSVHKLASEHYLHVYSRQFAIDSIALRLSNVYGCSSDKKTNRNVVINKVIEDAVRTGQLSLFANRNCIRDYIHINDVINAFVAAGISEHLTSGAFYIIGSGEGKKIKDAWKIIADSVSKMNHTRVNISKDDTIAIEPHDLRDFVADYGRFERASGWRPAIRFQDGIEITVKDILSQLKLEPAT